MLTVNGNLEVQCNSCPATHSIPSADAGFDLSSQDERQMGFENEYNCEHSIDCDCGNTIEIECEVWEYPEGSYSHDDVTINGGTLINKFDYEFQQEQEPDEY